jgi:hypothetical protein
MDNMLRDTADLLDYIDKHIETFANHLAELDEGRLWTDFDNAFRPISRAIKSRVLTIDEAIRWD